VIANRRFELVPAIHAGAIVSGGKGTAVAKIEAFKAAGIGVAETPSVMADTLLAMM
jgi:succinyl-CoA synthetase alpha subunit